VRFFAPDVAFDDAEQYLPPLLARRGKPITDVGAALAWLRTVVEPVSTEVYATFEGEARERIDDRDENDWPVLATALALACAIWTEDADFFGAGIAVWTTNRIEIFFRQQLRALKEKDE
jgi:predicted nucleic acid-binding protein